MSKKTNTAAANKVNAPAIKDNGNATSGNANKGGNKGNKADKDTTPAPAPAAAVIDAATIASTAAAWLTEYKSIRGIKDTSATLISQHGRDTYKAVLAACKATRAASVAAMHASTAAAWTYSAVLDREYNAIKDGKDWRDWCGLIAANWPTAAAFVAACYPHTLEDGRPARPVDFTNGESIYRAYLPIKYKDGKDGGAAVDILRASLDNLKKVHGKAIDGGKDGGALVCTKVHKDGHAVAVYGVKLVDKTSKDGRTYKQAGKADKGAPLAVAVSVYSAGKDGHRLPTLAEYNADLRK